MPPYKLAVICRNRSNDEEFLTIRQPRPPKFGHDEYDSYVDSDLWDLPSVELQPLQGDSRPEFDVELEGAEFCPDKLNLRRFDLNSALRKVSEEVGLQKCEDEKWRFWKHVEEPEFGPGPPIQTIFIAGRASLDGGTNHGLACQWISKQTCHNWLLEVKQGSSRMGPLAVVGLLSGLPQSAKLHIPQKLRFQEYPPGIALVPMESRTGKPFRSTNLVILAPKNVPQKGNDRSFIAHGDALIVDPGCQRQFHQELAEIVTSLPRKLIVFITHHHLDHVDGLSVVEQCNPDAFLLAHENTMSRIGKGDWSLGYTSISGDEEICVGGEQLRVIFAPGHTDGHMGLLHVSTHSLIVGDHCVGEGSAVLDAYSGGNMADYFQTTYKFMDLSPHVLIPQHGRISLWPKHMLSGYLRNRRSRESAVLRAIENGANTLYDLVSTIYSEIDRRVWFLAGSNVRLHVEYLAQRGKLPEDFSLQKFRRTCGLHFIVRWLLAFARSHLVPMLPTENKKLGLLTAIAVCGFAAYYLYHKS